MNGKPFVVAFILFMLGFFLLAVLFNYYPPAANNWLTLVGFIVYVVGAVLIVRRVARK